MKGKVKEKEKEIDFLKNSKLNESRYNNRQPPNSSVKKQEEEIIEMQVEKEAFGVENYSSNSNQDQREDNIFDTQRNFYEHKNHNKNDLRKASSFIVPSSYRSPQSKKEGLVEKYSSSKKQNSSGRNFFKNGSFVV